MIDHVTVLVSNGERAKAMYTKALRPLGYEMVMELTRAQVPELPAPWFGGLGVAGKPDLWLRQSDQAISHTHIAFRAESRKAVDTFYEAALAAGFKDNGKPGLREDYHPNYYAAFVSDADGHNIEAVCHVNE